MNITSAVKIDFLPKFYSADCVFGTRKKNLSPYISQNANPRYRFSEPSR